MTRSKKIDRKLIKTLNLENILRVYELMCPYLPEVPLTAEDEGETALAYLGGVASRMVEEDTRAFIKIVSLFTGLAEDRVVRSDGQSALEIFVFGFIQNRIVQLDEFVRKIKSAESTNG